MNTKHLPHKLIHSRALVFAVTLLGGLALTLGLLWLVGGEATPVAAAPALDKAPSPAKDIVAKPLYSPLQASGWTTSTPIIVYNSGPAVLTDFQISLTIPYSAGMQTDFEDLRFGDADGNCLSYWVETYTVASALVWVKVPSIPTPTTTISMYYGNSTAISASNGGDTFEFFDDFEGTSLDAAIWSATSPANVTVAGGKVRINNGAVRTLSTVDPTPQNQVFEAKVRYHTFASSYSGLEIANDHTTAGSNSQGDAVVYIMTSSGGGATMQAWGSDGVGNGYDITGNGPVVNSGFSLNEDYIIGFEFQGTSNLSYFMLDYPSYSQRGRLTYSGRTWEAASKAYWLWLGYFTGAASGSVDIDDESVDWVRVRKYVTATVAPTTTLGSPTQVPDLAVVKSVTPTVPNAGGPITYTITFTNEGAVAATGAVITDHVPVSVTSPAQLWSCSGSANIGAPSDTFVWGVTNLAVDEVCVITITGQLSDPLTLPGGHIFTNTVVGATAGDCPCNSSDAVAVSVNHYPTATAGASPTDINLCATSDLDGSSSTDVEDPTSLLYYWDQTGGPDGVIANRHISETTFTGSCTQEGVVTLTLTVTDTGGLTDTADVTITVKNVPVAGLSVINSSTTTLGCTTYFTAEITDGSSVTYTWDFDDGTAPTVTTDSAHKSYAGHIYAPACVTTPITYTVVVTAQNGFITGTPPVYTTYTDTTTTIVTITNEAPVAVAGVAPPVDRHQQAVVDSLVTLDASDSYDPDAASCGSNDITEYHWEWTGGIVSVTLSDNSAISPTFTAPSPPTLPTVISFTLTVTDTGCLSATDLISITLVPTVGGHTAPVETSALLWPWVALVAVLGAMAAVVATALRRRTAHREFP